MRATVTLVGPAPAGRLDATIDAPGDTPTGEVLVRLAALAGASPHATPRLVPPGPGSVDPAAPVAESPLRDGVVVSFDAGPPRCGPASTGLELRVAGGPDAGSVVPLTEGAAVIGRAPGCDVRIDDPDVSRRHALLAVSGGAVTIADLGSTNGTRLGRRQLGAHPQPLPPGQLIHLGESTLVLASTGEPSARLRSTADGGLAFNRPPRTEAAGERPPRTITFPGEPQRPDPHRLPLVATLAPLAVGVALAAALHHPEYLLFTAVAPLMTAGQWLADRRTRRRTTRRDTAAHDAATGAAQHALAQALAEEEAERRRRHPDPAALAAIAGGPGLRLWERRLDDPDFLELRLGTAGLAAATQVRRTTASAAGPSGEEPDPPHVEHVPLAVALRTAGVVGVAGPVHRRAALARALVVQLAVLHSPRDLRVVLLTEAGRADEWAWCRWLPHLRADPPDTCRALIGLDPETAAARVTELVAATATRSENTAPADRTPVVVVVDGARELRRSTPLAELLACGPAVGIYAVCLDDDEASLPQECRAVARFTGPTLTRLEVHAGGNGEHLSRRETIADGTSASWAEQVARWLAPLRDETPRTGTQALPREVRWLDVASVHPHEIARRWTTPAGARSTYALLGVGTGGTFGVDLARDGPHALVAGTTGSGKSELLQTLVAALAVANRPDELGFVLVDYKGGAAFGACAHLPHTLGVVTDLDDGLAQRALVSLTAELKRRETLLAQVGATDVDTYRSSGHPLARLVIVVDEFASLADELPDFVGGLVGIAQRGRSLGVHLVLATQRPEGIVSAEIRANTNLRICLAVTRDAESRDVVDTGDAARISRTTPGRALARTGHGELHLFQCARIGGPAPATGGTSLVDVRPAPFGALARPAEPLTTGCRDDTRTDLEAVVTACGDAARELGIEPGRSPWLPPLPGTVVATGDADAPLQVTLGVHDLPERQAQIPYRLDLATAAHLLVVGSARSGRTSTLRTLAGGLARSTPTADLHLYALDCAGGALRALADLPHCGAIVTASEPERARRLLAMLAAELGRRRALLAELGLASVSEQRLHCADPLPHVVLLCDGWESMLAAFEDVDAGAIVDALFRLLREGAAAGLHVVVTAERAGLVGRLASAADDRLVLRLADRGDFALVGLPMRAVPVDLGPGRGFLARDLTQTQVCLLDDDASGPAQLAVLARIAEAAARRDAALGPTARPPRVDPLPDRVPLSSLARPDGDLREGRLAIGLSGRPADGGIACLDLAECVPGLLVAGPPRSGRSTALATIARGLSAAGMRTVGITPRPSPLAAAVDAAFAPDDAELSALLAETPAAPLGVLVDDAELVAESAAAALDRFARDARDRRRVLVVAGTGEELALGYRGFVADVRRSRCGVLLQPRGPLDGDVLGVRPPRAFEAAPPGRGLLVERGATISVQVALPS